MILTLKSTMQSVQKSPRFKKSRLSHLLMVSYVKNTDNLASHEVWNVLREQLTDCTATDN
jgi:hypothetical protein